jgi:hypothetical protein
VQPELISKILQTYDLSEIIELNDKTEEEVLDYLVTQSFLALPDPLPVDVDDD